MNGRRPLLVALAALLLGCSDVHPSVLATDGEVDAETGTGEGDGEALIGSTTGSMTRSGADSAAAGPDAAGEESSGEREAPGLARSLTGTVRSATSGLPLAGAVVTAGDDRVTTGPDGAFTIEAAAEVTSLLVERPTWEPAELALADLQAPVDVALEPRLVRGLRVSRAVASDAGRFDELLALADRSTVNALVFDTKDESATVQYETEVAFADQIGVVDPAYDPAELLAKARDHDLYAITRIVTFEDSIWARSDGEAKLAGAWVDAADRANWQYPIDLAVEACRLGFDEIQFDYVRFPSGRTAAAAANLVPPSEEERAAAISGFLAEARERLLVGGCGVSAAIFGIVMSSETDERLGQTPESISASVDAVSPMLYPSHYSPGWLGFADPNDHPGPVIAHALDSGEGRIATDAVVRPWLQGFYYGADDVRAQIDEAEARGAGWIIWNASGTYGSDWLPAG